MKVIDLLNKIANGEEVPEKINFNGEEYRLNYANTYVDKNGKYIFQKYNNLILNDEVEIIEEPQEHKIPEKLKLYKLSANDSANISTLQDFNNRNIQITINEILDYMEVNNG